MKFTCTVSRTELRNQTSFENIEKSPRNLIVITLCHTPILLNGHPTKHCSYIVKGEYECLSLFEFFKRPIITYSTAVLCILSGRNKKARKVVLRNDGTFAQN